jgi:very-short-patch-repair endonuclease
MPDIGVRERLLDQRQALLDLGTRNRLINVPMRVKGVRTVEIVDEKSSEIYRLLTQAKGLTFLPGREPPQEEQGELDIGSEATAVASRPVGDELDENGQLKRHTDTKLQTRLTAEGLQKRLFDVWYDARSFEEEQGVNILYLAFGLLRWFEDDKSDVARHAPLILLPVRLERSSAAERFSLHWRGEPASPNLSIQAKLRGDFGLVVDDFRDEDEVDIPAYLADIAKTVSGKPRWEVLPDAMVLGFFSFAKFLMYRDLDPENWPKGSPIDQHGPVAAMLGDGFEAHEPIVAEHRPIDPVIPPLAQNHVLDADSSQAVAIEEVLRGRHLVIKGPPGTGKSQTIANIIAGAALEGRKVLFVAEKMAALDVVQRRLRQVGLGPMTLELHSTKANKRLLLEELRRTRELAQKMPAQDPKVVARLGEVQDDLNRHAAMLHDTSTPGGISPYRLFGHLLAMREAGGLMGFAVEGATGWTAEQAQSHRDLMAELAARLGTVGDPAANIWRGVRRDAIDPAELERLGSLIRSVEADLEAVEEAASTVGHDFGLAVARIRDLDTLLRIARAAASLPPDADRQLLAQPVWRDDTGALGELITLGRSYQKVATAVAELFQPAAWSIDLRPVRAEFAARGASLFRFFSSAYRSARAQFKAVLAIDMPRDLAECFSLLDGMIKAQDQRRLFEAQSRLGAQAFGSGWAGETSDWNRLQAITDWWRDHRHPALGQDFLARLAARPRGGNLGSVGAVIGQSVPRLFDDLKQLNAFLDYDLERSHGIGDCADLPVAELSAQLRLWLANLESVTRWIAFANRCRLAREAGLGALVDGLLDGRIPGSVLVPTYERAYYEALRADLFVRHPDLKRFDGELQDRAVEHFKTLDRGRIALARENVALKHLRERPNALGGIGPLGVLNGEFAKKRNHLPIRQLLDKAGPAIQRLKPVMMMSPLSISQFLKPGVLAFDLLVIDEASQVEPVDALGAIARARQVVVVGDERQLPPTRFFAKLTGELDDKENDEETFKASDAESVLDLCLAKGMPYRQLNWHYRSKHQSLITVSNREFYDNRLMVVPSPYLGGLKSGSEAAGLVFRYLPNAVYDRGNTRTNPEEARVVAQAIMAHARHRGSQSLGVATFSVAQRQAILKELEVLRRASPATETFFNREGNEPFFVKNLENIQGDERDVIFISVGYGRSAEGYLAMSFGPLNLDGGERRLNVLISRAKYRCEVFSSIRGEDIDLERAGARGVAALKLFLTFAETGRLSEMAETGRGPDSLFEEHVAAQLRSRGHAVSHQIGSAGFFVDLAVTDPTKPQRFLLGIECDGAQYHASRSARDRDRLRQHVLEAQGWIIHRIWSTDWYLRPQEELAKVEVAIGRAKAAWLQRDEALATAALPVETEAEPEPEAEPLSPGSRQGGPLALVAEPELRSLAQPYVEAPLKTPRTQELHEITTARMAAYVIGVVQVEGPVHEQEIVTRIRDAFGLARAGNRVRDAVQDGIDVARMTGKITGGPFYALPDAPVIVRDRSHVTSAGLRRPEMLPTEEIEAAFLAVITANYGAPRDALLTAAARLFGFAATSSVLRERLDDVLTVMLFQRKLKRQNDLIVSG